MKGLRLTVARFLTMAIAVGFACLASSVSHAHGTRPNIVWIMAEDISTELGCYGHPAVETPHLDQLAKEGELYTRAFCTAPSCTPSRNAMMTGVYQNRTDTQDQRRRGVVLPATVTPIPKLLQAAGYYTALGCGYSNKTDLNFEVDRLFDGADWSGREDGQPFFAQITLAGTHRHSDWKAIQKRSTERVDPQAVELPPYFPDHPIVRQDWAIYLDMIERIDAQMGEIVGRLRKEGILDETVVIFIGDNGRCHLRGKCWLYDPGLQVPLIIRWPAAIEAGQVHEDLVSTIDISATILELAGVDLPEVLDGHPLWGPRARQRRMIFAARDLIDEVDDRIRCVRTARYKYIRNYRPELGYRDCRYVREHRPMLAVMEAMLAGDELTPEQRLFFASIKPVEELYDLETDPFELVNLAESPDHRNTLHELRAHLDTWISDTGDKGLIGIPLPPGLGQAESGR